MECGAHDKDFERQITYTQFFGSCGIPFLSSSQWDCRAYACLFQDLGDTSLYSYLKLPRNQQQVKEHLLQGNGNPRKTHGHATRRIHDCPALQERVFNYDHFRWEDKPISLNTLFSGHTQITIPEPDALKQEFHTLASIADAFPKTIIHRDLQSQNIMITERNVPRVIDYRGREWARQPMTLHQSFGTPITRLTMTYVNISSHITSPKERKMIVPFSVDAFTATLLPCRLQRHMQALGAYAFLSQTKGKRYFSSM